MPALLDNYQPYVPPASGLTGGVGANPYAGFIERYLATDPVKAAQLLGIDANVNNQMLGYQGQGYDAMINTGEIPAGYNVPDSVRLAMQDANRAGVSQWAQLADAYHNQRSSGIGNLGARGLVRSSAFGQHALQDSRNYGVAKAQALNTLQNQLYGYKQQGLQAQQAGIGQKVTAEQDALDRLYTMIQNGMIALPQTGVGAGGAGGAAPMKPYPAVGGYNPYGYVPGGSSPAVSSAITARALKGPLYGPSYNPQAYVHPGTTQAVQEATQNRGAAPQAYPSGIPSPTQSFLTPHGRSPY